MSLNSKFKQQLKAQAHSLKPIVLLGNHGLTDTVQNEIDRALTDHELIKVRIAGEDKAARKKVVDTICEKNKAEPIQLIGRILILYRKNPPSTK